MGDAYVEVELENAHDRVLVEHGYREAASVRQERVRVLADSGATLLLLPQDLVERLGLRITDQKVIVTYADEQKEERLVAGGVTVRVGERSMETECVVGPPRSRPVAPTAVFRRSLEERWNETEKSSRAESAVLDTGQWRRSGSNAAS
jgi:hypothetical protein